MTIIELHKLAFPRFGSAAHEWLHDAAALRWGVHSLRDCTSEQLDELAAWVLTFPLLPIRNPKSEIRNRPRSGRPARPGVLLMISDAQVGLIDTLASELAWSKDTLTRFLTRYFNVDAPRDLGTSQRAHDCIHQLLKIKRDKLNRQDAKDAKHG